MNSKLSLNGTWQVRGQNWSGEGQVPGCIHTDLMKAGQLPDLWWRDNEAKHHWVAGEDWTYSRSFEVSADTLKAAQVLIQAKGLDTLATLTLNGKVILKADNMFRTWEVDVKDTLLEGTNQIEAHFASPIPPMQAGSDEKRLPGWNLYHEDFAGKSYLRKMACGFGWDWGPMAPTAGIWRDMDLLVVEKSRITDLRIEQKHSAGKVELDLHTTLEGVQNGTWKVNVKKDGSVVAEADGSSCPSIGLENPELWWPNGMGEQPLYDVEVEFLVDGEVQDRSSRRIGLRTLALERKPDEFGESFRFVVNGRAVFAKGANWIPCDVFIPRISDETYAHLIQSTVECDMNMIRVWGGGIYEEDIFYELCDEKGIMIWQDFMFACSTYPTFKPDFMENVRHEVRDNLRHLRHHPCIALWCGNNELEQGLVQEDWTDHAMSWEDYLPLFDELIPEVIAEEDPGSNYWPSSAHTPGEFRHNHNHERAGDAHAWSVWFGGQPFEAQRTWMYRFMSEFGFQSFPEPKTVESFTEPEDRNLTSWIMDFHQRSGPGNQTIYKYLLDWFRIPKDFNNTLWMTQLTQALCIQVAAEHARRLQGRMDGLLYWQLNDIWPAATWSSIDVHGRWKALQFLSKRFFASVLVSVLENADKSSFDLHVSNHLPDDFQGSLRWRLVNPGGQCLLEGEQGVDVPSQNNLEVVKVDVSAFRGETHRLPLGVKDGGYSPYDEDRGLILWTTLVDLDGKEQSRNMGLLARPKHLQLREPTIGAKVTTNTEGTCTILLTSDLPSPWTRLELDSLEGRFLDNFVHLDPSLPLEVELLCEAEASLVEQALRITPLISCSQ